MSISDIFWLFFIFTALQPWLRQRMLEVMRTRKIAQLEGQRNSRVILMVHRQETMRLLGFPLMRYIDINDSEDVLRAIRDHKSKVTVFVPHYAMSGGTLIALAADEIVMCRHSVLGPVDPQLGDQPAASLIKVVEQKPIAEIDDKTLIEADQARKSLNQVETFVRKMLEERMGEKAGPLAHLLASGTWTHDYPITVGEAREMGLTVSTAMPNEVYELMGLYPQTAQRRPSVEYVPLPYRGRQRELQPSPSSRGV